MYNINKNKYYYYYYLTLTTQKNNNHIYLQICLKNVLIIIITIIIIVVVIRWVGLNAYMFQINNIDKYKVCLFTICFTISYLTMWWRGPDNLIN